jgi:hypothetical protein
MPLKIWKYFLTFIVWRSSLQIRESNISCWFWLYWHLLHAFLPYHVYYIKFKFKFKYCLFNRKICWYMYIELVHFMTCNLPYHVYYIMKCNLPYNCYYIITYMLYHVYYIYYMQCHIYYITSYLTLWWTGRPIWMLFITKRKIQYLKSIHSGLL